MSTRKASWWLVGGTEQCPFCLQSYAVEVEVRCTGCDRGFCGHCIARVEVREELHARLDEEVWCPECAADEEAAAPRGRTAGKAPSAPDGGLTWRARSGRVCS